MKLNEIRSVGGAPIDLSDPDRAPGAYEKEGAARARVRGSKELAVEALNELCADFNLPTISFKIGQASGFAGYDYIVPTSRISQGTMLKGTKIKVAMASVDARSGDFQLTFEKALPKSAELDELNDSAKKELGLMSHEKFIQGASLNFGPATKVFSDPKLVKKARAALKAFIKIIKSVK